MAERKIKTGGTSPKNNKPQTGGSTKIQTSNSSSIRTGNTDSSNQAGEGNKGNFSLSNWVGEPNTNTTNDTGSEALNVSVRPAAGRVVSTAANKVVDKVVDKVIEKSISEKSGSKIKTQKYSAKKEVFEKVKANNIKTSTPRSMYTEATIKSNDGKIKTGKVDSKITYKRADGISNAKTYSQIKTSKLPLLRRERIKNAIKSGRPIGVNGQKMIVSGAGYVRVSDLKKAIRTGVFSRKKGRSNAQIDKSKISDNGIEGIQGARKTKDKLATASQTAKAVSTLGKIATGRYINEMGKKSLQGNVSYSSFYSTNANVDKSTTTNTGIEAIQGARVGIKSVKNVGVGIKNTAIGVKKSYRASKRIYTGTKTAVRNTARTIKAIKNARSAIERARIAAQATVRTVRAVVGAVKALASPFVLKVALIAIAAFFIIFLLMSAGGLISNMVNSMFGWLYPSDGSSLKPAEILTNYQQKIVTEAVNKNNYYSNASNFGVESSFVNGSVDPSSYKAVLAILVVQKQRMYEQNNGVDPNGIYDLKNFANFSDKEITNMFSKFYNADIQHGTYTTSSTSTTVNPDGTTTTSTSTTTHTCVRITIANYTPDNVMTKLGFNEEEKQRVIAIMDNIDIVISDDIKITNNVVNKYDGSSMTFPAGSSGKGNITSPYGNRIHPITNKMSFHSGIDIANTLGTAIYSARKGKVSRVVNSDSGYGNYIEIDHGNGVATLYAHMSKILVTKGQEVDEGVVVGLMGSTGQSTGSHLHFEVRINGQTVDPSPYLYK